jgi:hypothetical protein
VITQHEMARLVAAWEAGRDSTLTPRAQAMIEAEVARVKRAYEKMPIRVKFVDHDPYSSFEEMRDQVQSTGTMLVWTGASDTPLWDAQTNWQARAVHDYDHIQKSLDFSMEGEAATARHSAARMPGLAPMYISEIMLQAAVNNYTGKFVPQKLVLLSEQDERFATQLRGAGAEPTDAAQLVWETAGVLRVGSPESAMLHLGAAGVGVREATIILEAAQALNAKVDQRE